MIALIFRVLLLLSRLSYKLPSDDVSHSNLKPRKKWVFILGLPRSGTTIYYQKLCKKSEVGFITNRLAYFFQFFRIFKIKERQLINPRKIIETSNFGSTLKNGWNQPSEAGIFWKSWRSLTFSKKRAMLIALENTIPQSIIIIKNLKLIHDVSTLVELIDDIEIHIVQRKFERVLASNMSARNSLCVPVNKPWSVTAENVNFRSDLTEIENVSHQLEGVLKLMLDVQDNFPSVKIIQHEEGQN